MDYFDYKGEMLFAEGGSLTKLAEEYGTPAYIYSGATIERHWLAFGAAFARVEYLKHQESK